MRLSDVDAYMIRRAMARMPIELDNVSPIVAMLLTGIDTSTPDGWNLLSDLVNKDAVIGAQVMAIDPKKPLPKSDDSVYVPPLPGYAVPYLEDARADYAPYYDVRGREPKQINMK